MATLFVDKIDPQSGTSLEIGSSGDTITIPAGATITNNGTQTGFGGTNTPAFEAKMSATQNIGDDTLTKLQFNTEVFDTDSCYDNSTNYRFTPTVAGKYFCYFTISVQQTGGVSQLNYVFTHIYKNGSGYKTSYFDSSNNRIYATDLTITATIDFNGSSDYIEAYALIDALSGDGQALGTTYSAFGAYKILT